MAVITRCNVCGEEFEADRQAIMAGTWRTCPRCRAHPAEPTPRPAVCGGCGKVLKSGAHRNGCPGRSRRRRSTATADGWE